MTPTLDEEAMTENRSLFQKNDATVNENVDRFLKDMKAGPRGSGRLIFALDATASRKQAWDLASQLQSEMFREAAALGGLSLQLVYYRGFGECKASDWVTESGRLLHLMERLECVAGMTQIGRVLTHAKDEAVKQPVSALVFIGDAIEENPDVLVARARELGIRMFMFQEGADPMVRSAFRAIAHASDGVYARFDSGAAKQLGELLKAVAVFATGGAAALEGRKDAASILLIDQLKGGA
jgi:hypothetical protein